MFQRVITTITKPPKFFFATVVAFTTASFVTCWCESSQPVTFHSSHIVSSSSSSKTTTTTLSTTSSSASSTLESSSVGTPTQPHQVLSFSNRKKKLPTVLIIGDIHGCYDEMIQLHHVARQQLLQLQQQQQQDNNKDDDFDAIVCVGDIVNKGPQSYAVMQHVQNHPNWYTVRGNHEEGVLRFISKNINNNNNNKSEKYAWTQQLTPQDIEWIKELPYTIWLEPYSTCIVHSGLVPGIPLEQQSYTEMITMRNINGIPWAHVWNQYHSTAKTASSSSLSFPIIFGHDAKRGLQTYPMALGLDTGCCYGKMLTGVILPYGKLVQVPAKQVYCPIVYDSKE